MIQALVASAALTVSAGALAAGTPALEPAPGAGGSQPPGSVTAAQVVNKWLLDSNGKEIGWIDGVAEGGTAAAVRTDDGRRTTVPISRLSLGNGPNTVIEATPSGADQLNRMELGVGASPRPPEP